jgi:hypothetical protein
MPTIEEKLAYRKEFLIGADEYDKSSSDDLWKRLYQGVIETSTVADLRLIGAWVTHHEGMDRAVCYAAWPSVGHAYALVDTEGFKRIVKVVNARDHRNGVAVLQTILPPSNRKQRNL